MTLRPQFFLVRPGAEQLTPTGQILVQPATAVPLIPADLLPEWVEVIGVPRSLSPDDTKEMGNLGVFHAEMKTYKLRFAPITEDEACASDESTARTSVTQPSPTSMGPSSSSLGEPDKNKPTTSSLGLSHLSGSKPKLKPAQGLSSSRHNPNNQQQQSAQPVPAPPPASPKEASPNPNTTTTSSPPCRHWCHHGVCRWGLSCHYEHTMPTTPAGLAEVGLSRVPDWWLQARGFMAMPPDLLRAADACSGRRSAKKMVASVKKQKFKRSIMKRGDVQGRHHDEASEAEAEAEAEAEDEYEEDEDLVDDELEPELKRGMEEILIDLD